VARRDAPDVATARRIAVRRRSGVVALRLPPGAAAGHVVSASAFSARGARGPVARTPLR
jgi:hypothetical protein